MGKKGRSANTNVHHNATISTTINTITLSSRNSLKF